MHKVKHNLSIVPAMIASVLLAGCVTPTSTYTPPSPPIPKMPTATANVRQLSRVTHDPAPEVWPRISPDGGTLLFIVLDLTKQGGEAWSIASIKVGAPGRNLVAGPYAAHPAWYPDGKTFVYQYLKRGKAVLVRSPVGGVGMTFITPNPMGDQDAQPAVSPDGKRIAFHTRMGGGWMLCTVNADGSNFTVYVEGCSPRWHPDGSVLAFDKKVGPVSHIFTLDLGSGQVTQLTTGDSDNGFPVWSPDGKWLVFRSNRDGKKHLYAMKRDGTAMTQLTKGETEEDVPDWSTDGFIYFISDAGAPNSDTPYSDIWRLSPVLSE